MIIGLSSSKIIKLFLEKDQALIEKEYEDFLNRLRKASLKLNVYSMEQLPSKDFLEFLKTSEGIPLEASLEILKNNSHICTLLNLKR